MRFRKILRSPTSKNHSLNARSPLRNDELQFCSRPIETTVVFGQVNTTRIEPGARSAAGAGLSRISLICL